MNEFHRNAENLLNIYWFSVPYMRATSRAMAMNLINAFNGSGFGVGTGTEYDGAKVYINGDYVGDMLGAGTILAQRKQNLPGIAAHGVQGLKAMAAESVGNGVGDDFMESTPI